jgi:hypothetical protein
MPPTLFKAVLTLPLGPDPLGHWELLSLSGLLPLVQTVCSFVLSRPPAASAAPCSCPEHPGALHSHSPHVLGCCGSPSKTQGLRKSPKSQLREAPTPPTTTASALFRDTQQSSQSRVTSIKTQRADVTTEAKWRDILQAPSIFGPGCASFHWGGEALSAS